MTQPRPVVSEPPVAGGLDVDLPGQDVRLRATRWPGSGTPVLLLHGLASTRHIWDLVVPGLAGLPVLALDQRGHGDSDRPTGPYDGETVLADALTALDALGLSRVVVVGHSWGAWTALRLAARAPERVLAVVCVDGGTLRMRDLAVTREQVREMLTPPRIALPVEELRVVLRDGPLRPWWTPAVERAVLSIFAVGDDGLARARLLFESHMAIVDDLLDVELEPLLPDVRCPAWLVSCSPDAPRADALERTAALLPQARTLRWEGAVHDVPLQWPALVAGVVRAAADEVSLRQTGEGSGS
ncbi:MAG: alpha/beta hydrolase fold containing protein [Frankiales bacterium]|nr:alpha/beta hydrolase fold containing protein [Frankiales bacterium]